MSASRKLRGLVALLVLGLLVILPAGSLASGSTSNWVGVGQTVVAATEATGKITGKPKVFTQFSANGKGPATLKVPMSESGFRNLSGLGTPPIADGYAVWKLHLSGPTHARAVANFPTDKLPLKVSAAYELDGKKMSAKEIVGKSGKLKVSYVITNATEKDTKVTFKNALGEEETTTVKAPIPVAAILNVTIPADFTNVNAPNAGYSATGNGTSTASWTVLLFNPLGGVKQSVSYEAHVTNVNVPSATLEAQVVPPKSVKPLPTIPEPGAPAVPTLTLGGHLASLQSRFQAKLRDLSAKASAALNKFKQVAVPAAKTVSGNAAELATSSLPAASEAARKVSTNAESTASALSEDAAHATENASRMADLEARLGEDEAESAEHASRVHEVRVKLEGLPALVQRAAVYGGLLATVVALEGHLNRHAARLEARLADAKRLEGLMIKHSVRLEARAARAKELQSAALEASTNLTEHVDERASSLSTQASEIAETLANATLSPRERKSKSKAIQTKQVGGGAHLDAAVGQLDSALTSAGEEIDKRYAYLTALDKRAAENLLPTGNAIGATYQVGAYLYSIEGANNTAHEIHLASFIGGFALTLGIMFGIGLYRVRRGLPSSLAPPKSPPAAAKG
jgi:hypothetical protein